MVFSRFRGSARVFLAAAIVGGNIVAATQLQAYAAPARDDVTGMTNTTTASLGSAQVAASSALSLSSNAVTIGGQVTATVTIQNQGSSTSLRGIVVAARTPSGANADLGGVWNITLSPGQTIVLQKSRVFSPSDPLGAWTIFASYQTSDSIWHPLLPTLTLTVNAVPTATPVPPTATPQPTATAVPTSTPPVLSSGGPIALGATIKDNGTSVYPASSLLDWYAGMTGRMPAIVNVGSDFVHGANFDPILMDYLRLRGVMPEWTWSPNDNSQGASQPNYTDRIVAGGRYDTYIRQFAQSAKNWGHPFFLRFGHEMNGGWFSWGTSPSNPNGNSPADFVAMWQHVHDIFTSVGATNVRWVWCPNVSGGPLTPYSQDYPGDNYVDWVALDGYNWGYNQGHIWQSLYDVFSASYQQITALTGRPLMINEMASTEAGGSKASWITTGLLNDLPRSMPRVRAVLWFDWSMEQDWRVNSSASALAAFRSVVASPLYQATIS